MDSFRWKKLRSRVVGRQKQGTTRARECAGRRDAESRQGGPFQMWKRKNGCSAHDSFVKNLQSFANNDPCQSSVNPIWARWPEDCIKQFHSPFTCHFNVSDTFMIILSSRLCQPFFRSHHLRKHDIWVTSFREGEPRGTSLRGHGPTHFLVFLRLKMKLCWNKVYNVAFTSP